MMIKRILFCVVCSLATGLTFLSDSAPASWMNVDSNGTPNVRQVTARLAVDADNTLWRGNDFGSGIEEIYITEPTKDEKARYDIIGLLGKHQGFSVTGNGTDTFTLTASTPERSVEGIQKITVKVDPKTVQVKSLEIEFDQQLGSISASVLITQYKPGQKFDKKTFTCPVKDYKDAEIIDLR